MNATKYTWFSPQEHNKQIVACQPLCDTVEEAADAAMAWLYLRVSTIEDVNLAWDDPRNSIDLLFVWLDLIGERRHGQYFDLINEELTTDIYILQVSVAETNLSKRQVRTAVKSVTEQSAIPRKRQIRCLRDNKLLT